MWRRLLEDIIRVTGILFFIWGLMLFFTSGEKFFEISATLIGILFMVFGGFLVLLRWPDITRVLYRRKDKEKGENKKGGQV